MPADVHNNFSSRSFYLFFFAFWLRWKGHFESVIGWRVFHRSIESIQTSVHCFLL